MQVIWIKLHSFNVDVVSVAAAARHWCYWLQFSALSHSFQFALSSVWHKNEMELNSTK